MAVRVVKQGRPAMSGSASRSTSTDVFDFQKTRLRDALEDIHAGRLQLPDFQRSWNWPDSNVVSLLESLGEGRPIGAAMFLETGGSIRFDHRPVEGSECPGDAGAQPDQLVMDGQQRLTALYQVLYARAPVRIGGDRHESRRLYYMDIRKAGNSSVPLGRAIISVQVDEAGLPVRKGRPPYHRPEYQCANLVFPLNMTFRFREWKEGFDAHWNDNGREERLSATGHLEDYRSGVNDVLTGCMLPIILLRRGMTVDGICSIYGKLNSKGVPLETFDVMIARYAASGFDLREDWLGSPDAADPGRKARIDKASKGLLDDLTPKTFLSCVSMLAGLRAGKTVLPVTRAELLNLPLGEYKEFRDAATRGYIAAAKFLVREAAFVPRELRSMDLATALAAVLGHLGGDADAHEVQRRISRWFRCMANSGAYANGGEKTMAVDVPAAVRWVSL